MPNNETSQPDSTATIHRPDWAFLLQHPAHLIALGFGSGLSPKAPGTFGTLFAWISFVLLNLVFNDFAWAFVIAVSFATGLWACQHTATRLNIQDPGSVVWDEVVAFWIVLWIIMPASFWQQMLAFALFRLFDAVKYGPVAWADQTFKGWGYKGAFGIMFDDLIAAFLTLVVMATIRFLF